MKKLNYLTPVCEIIKKWPVYGTLIEEDVLNLKLAVISAPNAYVQIQNCLDYLRVNDGSGDQDLAALTADRILFEHFETVFKEATNLRVQTSDYITGLKIYFGLEGNNVKLIYKPVCMNKNGDLNDYLLLEGNCYVSDGLGNLVKIDCADVAQYKQKYEENIRIKHFGSQEFEKILSVTEADTDARGVIFPFQTIFSLMYENMNELAVFFHNAIRGINIYRNDAMTVKHCLLISNQNVLTEEVQAQAFAKTNGLLEINLIDRLIDDFANRSHLCPPKCGNIDLFNVVRTGTDCTSDL